MEWEEEDALGTLRDIVRERGRVMIYFKGRTCEDGSEAGGNVKNA